MRISIHAPRKGERRAARLSVWLGSKYFNPRSPQGGATLSFWRKSEILSISIHAPRKGERHLRKYL